MAHQATLRTSRANTRYSVLRTQYCVLAWLALFTIALATESPTVRVETTVGVEGVYILRDSGEPIVARHVDDGSPILLRIADTQRDGAATLYEVRYIGNYPGEFDLRDYLQRVSGDALTDVAAANVRIDSLLPNDHSGELLSLRGPGLPWPWPYRVLAAMVTVAWLAPVAIFVLRRWGKKPITPAILADVPTLADRLRSLVAAAIAGRSSVEQLAELERMLLSFWRTKLGLEKLPTSVALEKLREHPEAGRLLRSLEAWLHEPRGRRAVDINELLAPYQYIATPSFPEAAV